MGNLTDKQYKAVELLLEGKERASVCEELGIDRKTLYNWEHTQEFKQALAQGRRAGLERTVNVLSRASVLAAAALVGVLQDEKATPNQRIRASQTILAEARQLIRDLDLAAKLDELDDLKGILGVLEDLDAVA